MTGDPTNRRNLVEIMAATVTRHASSNEEIKTWAKQGEAWVSIDPRRGRERFDVGSKLSETTHVVRGHYYDFVGVTTKMRIHHGSRVFEIVAIRLDEDYHVDAMIDCLEVRTPQ